ncbi:hypothetical protein M3181_10385 [Mesobacillus maritimus]|uniref:hypothetical protein n=1 Tax=Mesobacillus maritimus TaxID=1643336 RepID=UPI0020403BCE|nr:hypothetical protein [Mesobacillus maritimus]MCM3669402.1 hypothetical protein [Mesobacillus maritimus]
MSINLYQIHIQTTEKDKVEKMLVHYLEQQTNNRSVIIQLAEKTSINFFTHEIPTMFAVSIQHEGWVTVLHDSFDHLNELTEMLSNFFNTMVIHALGQSTVDNYYLSVYQHGILLRVISYEDDNVEVEQKGRPFSFEKLPIGKNIGTDSVPSYVFDYNEMQSFCLHFQVDLLSDVTELNEQWMIIQYERTNPSPTNRRLTLMSKLFDKFKLK